MSTPPWRAKTITVKTVQSDVSIPTHRLSIYSLFTKYFSSKKKLGEGGNGAVHSYEYTVSKIVIVVKTASSGQRSVVEQLRDEIENFKHIGKHDHIVEMLTYCTSYGEPGNNAIFLELCDLGDLKAYADSCCEQEQAKGNPTQPSEITIWKLFKDITLGLNYLHNDLDHCYVHTDLKPDNILVSRPKYWSDADGLPLEPTFKITDFGPMTQYPLPRGAPLYKWAGTPEYAPPLSEQTPPLRPSGDIWSLGATIQFFALGHHPVQSREVCIALRRALGKDVPNSKQKRLWSTTYWRRQRPTVYRPLNVDVEELKGPWDLGRMQDDYEPYSSVLNREYKALWEKDSGSRITSKMLVKDVIPMMNGQIALLKSQEKKE